jgi:hypothetical protein
LFAESLGVAWGRVGTLGSEKDADKQLDDEVMLDGMEFGEKNGSNGYVDEQLDKEAKLDGIWVQGFGVEKGNTVLALKPLKPVSQNTKPFKG